MKSLVVPTLLLFGAACSGADAEQQGSAPEPTSQSPSGSGITLDAVNPRASRVDGENRWIAFDVTLSTDKEIAYLNPEIVCSNNTNQVGGFGGEGSLPWGEIRPGDAAGTVEVFPPADCQGPANLIFEPTNADWMILDTFTFPVPDELLE